MTAVSSSLGSVARRALLLASLLAPAGAAGAEPPAVRQLRTQRVGDVTYFHVIFKPPAELQQATLLERPDRLPALVSQDDRTYAVFPHVRYPGSSDRPGYWPTPLEFVGKVRGDGAARLLLHYEVQDKEKKPGDLLARLTRRRLWEEAAVKLDFSRARSIAHPPHNVRNNRRYSVDPDDLEGCWALGQAAHFAVRELQAVEFGFHGFAREATARKYGLHAPSLIHGRGADFEHLHRRLYETTTGAAAITESLQLQRMLGGKDTRHTGRRSIDIWSLPGIDIAEHPWEKMMAGKKPAPEPLARLVPHDQFYLHFKNIARLIEFGELFDQWGTNALRAWELTSREYDVQKRYERQLCLKSTGLARTFGPAVVRSLALTGSDGYLREGSDLTVLFHVTNAKLFLAAVNPFVQEARKEFGSQLKEGKADYHGVTVESFVTPLREVSLYRAAFGDFVIYSNSPTALRRILDSQAGRLKALADALDFQYMRTVFRLEDKEEDGFVFLSDAFIRQLVGPASKIKEKRRLEALTSLSLATHGALFAAWETGRLPSNQHDLIAGSGLKPEELDITDGLRAAWDGAARMASSDVYNTLHFATPLIELPIDKVTATEAEHYRLFRAEYLNLWRQFFDPVGIRLGLDGKRVKIETYILPLIQSSRYSELRALSDGGTTELEPSRIPSHTLAQWMAHLRPNGFTEGIGSWIQIRLDDGPELRDLVEYWIERQTATGQSRSDTDWLSAIGLALRMRVTLGIDVKNRERFDGELRSVMQYLGSGNPLGTTALPEYKGMTIRRLQLPRAFPLLGKLNPKDTPPPLYYGHVGTAWYLSTRVETIKEIIDQQVARSTGKEKPGETVAINSSLYFGPSAIAQSGEVLRSYLEWESHRRAIANAPIWDVLYRAGVVAPGDTEPKARAAALHHLGFVPVSPDGTAYKYDPKRGEVINERHGSPRQPHLHSRLAESSPLGKLLEELRSVRADLRFREDGIHTVLTIERK